mmetsp:Transcript_29150/g.93299  ORF Transcript_29150/g.93299 Transcript_29150/m.93299 type:complete len:106 (-) Transcript_29150:1693-2010(-)
MFKANHEVIHFVNPKVQASIGANTYVVSGPSETKQLQDLLPGILNQLGADNIQNLRQIAEQMGAGAGMPGMPSVTEQDEADVDDEDDDDVPDLEDIDDFEAVSNK